MRPEDLTETIEQLRKAIDAYPERVGLQEIQAHRLYERMLNLHRDLSALQAKYVRSAKK